MDGINVYFFYIVDTEAIRIHTYPENLISNILRSLIVVGNGYILYIIYILSYRRKILCLKSVGLLARMTILSGVIILFQQGQT